MRLFWSILTTGFMIITSLSATGAVAQESKALIHPINLMDAISIAMENNDEINALRSEVDSARANLRKARAGYLFNLSATGEISQYKTFPEQEMELPPEMGLGDIDFAPSDAVTKSISFNLVQPISTFGLIPASVKAAKFGLKAKEEELKQKKFEITLTVIESFYGEYLAERAVEIRESEVTRSEMALENAKRKFEVGQSPRFDVIRSEVTFAQAKEELLTAKKNSEAALLTFQRLLGVETLHHPDFSSELKILPWRISLDECIERALDSRAELKQLKAGINSQNALISINRLRPNLNFIGNLTYSDTASSGFTGKNSWAWLVQLTVPIFDGGKSKHSVDEIRGKRDAMEKRLDDLVALVKLDVQTNHLALEEAEARVQSSSKILEQGKEALHMAEVGYEEGVITYLDLVTSQNQLTQAELNNLLALTDYRIAYARMLKSIGMDPGMVTTSQ